MVTERTVMETECGNIKGIETRKASGTEMEGLVTRIEVSLADILEIKLGRRGAGESEQLELYVIEGGRDRRTT